MVPTVQHRRTIHAYLAEHVECLAGGCLSGFFLRLSGAVRNLRRHCGQRNQCEIMTVPAFRQIGELDL